MSMRRKCFRVTLAGLLTATGASAAFSQTSATAPAPKKSEQESEQKPQHGRPEVFFPMTEQPEMEMHHHGQISVVLPQFPRLGDSRRVICAPIYEWKNLEKMASEHNPTLAQAQREIEAARAQTWQAGLYPNPTGGYKGGGTGGGT